MPNLNFRTRSSPTLSAVEMRAEEHFAERAAGGGIPCPTCSDEGPHNVLTRRRNTGEIHCRCRVCHGEFLVTLDA